MNESSNSLLCGIRRAMSGPRRVYLLPTLPKNTMHKLRSWVNARSLALLAFLATSYASLAEGNTFTIDTSAASTAVTELKTKITSFFTNDILVAVLAILGSGIVIWLVMLAWRAIRRHSAKAG